MTGSSQRRRRDPQPASRGGELALIAGAAVLLLIALAALTGLGAAAALFGGGWVWPASQDGTGEVLGGLLSGQPGRGLPARLQDRLPGPGAVYSTVAVATLLAAALTTTGGVVFWRYRRPTDARRGMATRAEAAQVLGRGGCGPPARSSGPTCTAAAAAGRDERRDGRWGTGAGECPAKCPREGVAMRRRRVDPAQLGWQLGRSLTPRGVELWVRYDRTTGVYGAQGCGKTLDLLAPALLAHPGAAMATLTKLDDLLLTLAGRQAPHHGPDGAGQPRPVAVLDPFGMAPGVPELVWDPIAGCVDPMLAERRAKAFAAGTVTGAVAGGRNDSAARFYAAETAKVLQGFFHAAALTGRTLEHVLEWVANPVAAEQPAEILRQHPHAARFWDGLLSGALHGSADTVGNTVTTVQQAMSLFFQPVIRARCVPGPARPATDLAALLTQGGTVYLLGREDPYASASPLMTAVAEHVLDTALAMAAASPHGRVTPSFLACLDELPSTTPLPTLRVRMANERALGLSFIYAAQTWRQMVVC